ncbi:hypothetical protein Q1695_001563 [Nippostrongylus brasiliensis]|nr:hypothetical protein Q1695_001563 [Nippostrongylus brasiliensis]
MPNKAIYSGASPLASVCGTYICMRRTSSVLPPVTTERRLRVLVYNKVRKLAGHEFFIDVKENDTIEKVKLAIEDATSVPHEIQWIIFGVRNLEDTVRLSDHHIRDGYTIYSVPTYVEIQSMPNL